MSDSKSESDSLRQSREKYDIALPLRVLLSSVLNINAVGIQYFALFLILVN